MSHRPLNGEEYPLDNPLPRGLSIDQDEGYPATLHNRGLHYASIAEKKRLWWRNAIINALFIASWFLFATLLSVYNKWMFSKDHFAFPAPLFVTTMHMFVQFILAALLRALWPMHFRPDRRPTPEEYGKKVFPTALATSLDIGLSNLSLKTITLSFYTMCKSSSLIFVLFFAFIFKLEVFSWRLIGVIFLIFSGVVLMVATETHFILEGLILVLSASALGGLRWTLTQVLLKNKKLGLDNPAATIFWLSPAMGAILAVVSVTVEHWRSLFGSDFFRGLLKTSETVFYLTAPGILAFCMVLSEYYIIQRTGVVPMSIAGIAKEVSTITISSWFFGDELTPLNITGVGITVCGITLFTYHKYRKSMESPVPLDAHGDPVSGEVDEPLGRSDDIEDAEEINLLSRSDDLEEVGSPVDDRSRPSFSSGSDTLEVRSNQPSEFHREPGHPGKIRNGAIAFQDGSIELVNV